MLGKRVALIAVCLLVGAAVCAQEFPKGCGLMNCGCHWDRTMAPEKIKRKCENEELHKKMCTCWKDITTFHCTGKEDQCKTEIMDKAFAEAKKTQKLVLYVGNTGG